LFICKPNLKIIQQPTVLHCPVCRAFFEEKNSSENKKTSTTPLKTIDWDLLMNVHKNEENKKNIQVLSTLNKSRPMNPDTLLFSFKRNVINI